MNININELIFFRHFNDFKIKEMVYVANSYDDNFSQSSQDELIDIIFESLNHILKVAKENNLSGNLWHGYLSRFLIENENSFSLSSEITTEISLSMEKMALHDLEIIKDMYNINWEDIQSVLNVNFFDLINNFESINETDDLESYINNLNKKLADSKTAKEMFNHLSSFYKTYGVGMFGLNKAFKIIDNIGLVPIKNCDETRFSDLIGYESQKSRIIINTESFIKNKKANNVLLYGYMGTGKSSTIKATLNEYYKDGLRMIDIYKHQFKYIPELISKIKNRNYFFILNMDDLSFDDYENDYKYLKAVIEGGLENRPNNVLIYATSNKKHLIDEKWSDRESYVGDVHVAESMQEKLSLFSRFGETIYYGSPSEEEYLKIVNELAKRNGLENIKNEDAIKWYRNRGDKSGRTAEQFINHLIAQKN